MTVTATATVPRRIHPAMPNITDRVRFAAIAERCQWAYRPAGINKIPRYVRGHLVLEGTFEGGEFQGGRYYDGARWIPVVTFAAVLHLLIEFSPRTRVDLTAN
jgi:hypothetical protein